MSSHMLPEFQKICNAQQEGVLVRIRFRDKVLAGVPKNGNPLDYYVNSKHMSDEEKADFVERVKQGEVTPEEKEEIKETSCLQFEKDHDGDLCIYHGNIKALLREIFVCTGLSALRAKGAAKKGKGKNEILPDGTPADSEIAGSDKFDAVHSRAGGRQNLGHMIHIDPVHVKIMKDGKPTQNPDGVLPKVKHFPSPTGPKSALGNHDFFEYAEMEFVMKWYKGGIHNHEQVKLAMALAQDDGLGACRSQGFGKFDIVKWETLADVVI
jgi:hypothetical protein